MAKRYRFAGEPLTMGCVARTLVPMLKLRIKELRTAQGMTQAQLAEKAGVGRGTVNRLERSRPASIDFVVLERLADALGINAALLIVHEPKGKRG